MGHESPVVVVASEKPDRAGTSEKECMTGNYVDTARSRVDLVGEVASCADAAHPVLLEEAG